MLLKIRKVKEVKKEKDPATGADIVKKVDEYFLYSETRPNTLLLLLMTGGTKNNNALKIYSRCY